MESQQVSTITFSDCVGGCVSYTHALFMVIEVCVCVFGTVTIPLSHSVEYGNLSDIFLSLLLQGVTVMVQGQGQTAGQLQVIPQGVTVIPAAGQQIMQAVLPNGQVQRFLFTPTPASPSTAGTRGFNFTQGYPICQM